jgi:hypothetical protein
VAEVARLAGLRSQGRPPDGLDRGTRMPRLNLRVEITSTLRASRKWSGWRSMVGAVTIRCVGRRSGRSRSPSTAFLLRGHIRVALLRVESVSSPSKKHGVKLAKSAGSSRKPPAPAVLGGQKHRGRD